MVMNKIHKGLRALKLVLRHPWLLNNVLDDEEVCKERFCRKYAMPDGLSLLHLNTLFPDFAETVSPYAYLSGATMPIDIALLKALARRQNVKTYFEIGTWRGESVANVAAVVPQCVTLNLSREDIIALTGDARYADAHARFSRDLNNVTHLQGNSQTFDFTPHLHQYDMVFIDGDHHAEAVLKDTQTAFRLLKDEKSVIVWHDYGYDPETVRWSVLSAIWEGTPEGKRKHLYHVANTMCAVYLPEELPAGTLVPNTIPDHFFEVNLKWIGCENG